MVRRWRSISFDRADLPGPALLYRDRSLEGDTALGLVGAILCMGSALHLSEEHGMCYEERFFSRRTDKKVRKSERPDAETGRVPPRAHPDRPKPEMTAPKRPERELETV